MESKTKLIQENLLIKIYMLSLKKLKGVPQVCGSLREAMESLDKDRGFFN